MIMSSTSSSNSTGRASDDQTGKINDKSVGSCASCGIKEDDDIKLKICTACKSVRYCGVECQKKHRPKHKKDCKKRAAELRDELLFKQSESSHLGGCPICFLPHSLDITKSILFQCCSQAICTGCAVSHALQRKAEGGEGDCPFCRSPRWKTDEQREKYTTKRLAVNCPVALREMGVQCYQRGKYTEAFDYLKRAADLGNADAHFHMSVLYDSGNGVEKDKKKQIKHLETAAIGGHPGARQFLSEIEFDNKKIDRAIKHLVIAGKLGHVTAIELLREFYAAKDEGILKKEVFAETLRGYQAALEATKSRQRDEGDEFRKRVALWKKGSPRK